MLEPSSRLRRNDGDETPSLLRPAVSRPGAFSRMKLWALWLLVATGCAFWLSHSLLSTSLLSGEVRSPHRCSASTLKDNGLTKDVQWDGCSLFIKGQRVFLWSGEIHPWRIPVQSQWLDILQKIKATGMNAISVYAHWYVQRIRLGI
jgi:hypothetical protein